MDVWKDDPKCVVSVSATNAYLEMIGWTLGDELKGVN